MKALKINVFTVCLHCWNSSPEHTLKKTPQMLAHPPCFGLVVSPTYCSLCLLLFGKWLLLSWVTGQNQAMHISLNARRTTLMVELKLSGWEESKRSSRMRHCLDQGKPQLTPSSTGTSITIQKHSSCPAILLHLLHHGYLAPVHKPPCVSLLTTAPSALLTSADTCCSESPPFDLKYQFIPIMTKEYH